MTEEGRKNNAVVTMCAGEHDAPPDAGAIIDLKNTSIPATPLRLLSKVGRTNLYDQFRIGFDQAEAYRKSVGQYLRKNQWDNVTVEVFI